MISCKNCSANAKFDIETQQMKCEFCGSFFPMEEYIEKRADAGEVAVATASKWLPKEVV